MVSASYDLSEDDIKTAILFWLECGMKPALGKGRTVSFNVDRPVEYHPTDHGSGITATVSGMPAVRP